MNVESEEYTFEVFPENIDDIKRQPKKVVRRLRPDEEIEKLEEDHQKSSMIVFRLKRNSEVASFDLLAIDNLEIPQLSKKLQTKQIDDLESIFKGLSVGESAQKAMADKFRQDAEKFKEGLLSFKNDEELKLVLKKIDPSKIFEEKDSQEFSKSYKTIYNDMLQKNKREAKLMEKRKEIFAKFLKDKKNSNVKVYDVNLKKGPSVPCLNGKPMIVHNLLEMVSRKEENKGDIEIEDPDEYDYLYLDRASNYDRSQAGRIAFDETLVGKLTTDLADENNLVHDNKSDKDSVAEMKNDCDNFDSNSEDNPAFDYPDEEAEGLDNSNDEEESDFGDYDEDEDNDDDSDMDEDAKRRKRFLAQIEQSEDDDFQWPRNNHY